MVTNQGWETKEQHYQTKDLRVERIASRKSGRLWLQLVRGATSFHIGCLTTGGRQGNGRVKATCGCEVSHFKRLANRANQDHRLGMRKHLAKPNSCPLSFLTAYCPFTHQPLPTHSAYTSLASGHARRWAQSTLEPRSWPRTTPPSLPSLC